MTVCLTTEQNNRSKLGLSYKDMEDRGVLLPVRDLNIKYYLPVYYDDEVTIKTRLSKKPNLKVIFDYTVIGANDQIHCEARTTLVFVDATTRKPIRTPQFFEGLISPYF